MRTPHHFLRFIEGTDGAAAGQEPTTAPTDGGQDTPVITTEADTATHKEPEENQETFGRSYVEKLRKSEAGYRNKAKEFEAELATMQDRFKSFEDGLKKLAGVEGEEPSPEDALTAANQRAEQAAKELNEMRVNLAFTQATDGVADAKVLLPYMRGAGLLDGLDPTADDFASQVETLVNKTVEEIPAFKVRNVSASSGNAPTPTKPETGGKIAPDELARLYAAGNYEAINKAASEGRII